MLDLIQFYCDIMRISKAENIVLWDKIDGNVEFTQNIMNKQIQMIQDLKNESQQQDLPKDNDISSSFKITKKMLVKTFREQEQKTKKIHNKLAYLRLNQYRQEKALQMTKKKIIQLAGIRNRSLKQKQAMVEMRRTFDFQHSFQVESRSNLVRSSKKSRELAISKWKNTIQTIAESIRIQKNRIHSMTSQQKREQKDLKLRQVEKVRESLEKSRALVEQSHQNKIQHTKSRHKRQLEERFKKLNLERIQNQKLFHAFKTQTQRITTRQSKIRRQVEVCKSIWSQTLQNPENSQILFKSRLTPLTHSTHYA